MFVVLHPYKGYRRRSGGTRRSRGRAVSAMAPVSPIPAWLVWAAVARAGSAAQPSPGATSLGPWAEDRSGLSLGQARGWDEERNAQKVADAMSNIISTSPSARQTPNASPSSSHSLLGGFRPCCFRHFPTPGSPLPGGRRHRHRSLPSEPSAEGIGRDAVACEAGARHNPTFAHVASAPRSAARNSLALGRG